MFYEQELKTVLADVDRNLKLTNRSILRYFEIVGTYQSNSLGCGVDDTYTKGLSWIILDWRIKVIKRPIYRERLLLRTWSSGSDKLFAYRDYEMVNDKNEVCAVGTSRFVLRDIKEQKMAHMSEELTLKFQMEDKHVLPEEKFLKYKAPINFSNEFDYTIMRRDIDFNKHMHNLCHFDLAYEALPEEVYENCELNNFRITYKKEIKLGETVKCQYSLVDTKHIVYISNGEGNMNSIISLW